MKLVLLCVWAERAFLGSAKTAFKFKYDIKVVQLHKVERKEGTSAQGQATGMDGTLRH